MKFQYKMNNLLIFNQKRENLANDILFLAQHIRGCMESYKKFGEMIGKQENQENVEL